MYNELIQIESFQFTQFIQFYGVYLRTIPEVHTKSMNLEEGYERIVS